VEYDLVTDDHGDDADSAYESAGVGAPVDPTPHPAEAAAEDIDLELLDAIEQELADVELALERLGDGTYGRCETCGQVLSEDELETAPARRYCRAHLPLVSP
jgi:RNA polymerase-binding transcription factor DksA